MYSQDGGTAVIVMRLRVVGVMDTLSVLASADGSWRELLDFQIPKSECVLRIVRLLRGSKQIRHVIRSETPSPPSSLLLAPAGLVVVATRRSFKPSS